MHLVLSSVRQPASTARRKIKQVEGSPKNAGLAKLPCSGVKVHSHVPPETSSFSHLWSPPWLQAKWYLHLHLPHQKMDNVHQQYTVCEGSGSSWGYKLFKRSSYKTDNSRVHRVFVCVLARVFVGLGMKDLRVCVHAFSTDLKYLLVFGLTL